MFEIIPAILTNDTKELEEKLALLEGVTDRIQIDIIDGVFAENKTISLEVLENIETTLFLDIHLMTKNPTDWIERATRAGAERIIGQVEMMNSQEDFVSKVHEVGLKVGLALDLETEVEKLDSGLLATIDLVLLMSVKAGLGGQEFDNEAINKVKELDALRDKEELKFQICVDGGINKINIQHIAEAGANEVAIGQSIFEGNLGQNIRELKDIVDNRQIN